MLFSVHMCISWRIICSGSVLMLTFILHFFFFKIRLIKCRIYVCIQQVQLHLIFLQTNNTF